MHEYLLELARASVSHRPQSHTTTRAALTGASAAAALAAGMEEQTRGQRKIGHVTVVMWWLLGLQRQFSFLAPPRRTATTIDSHEHSR